MHFISKIHLVSAGYCALLISLNWSRSVEYSRKFGMTSESVGPVLLALLVSVAIVFVLTILCVRAAANALENGRKILPGRWVESWAVTAYALPLLWHHTTTSTWKEPDGAFASMTGGYGHAMSTWIFLFAIIGMLLFQIYLRLKADYELGEVA